MVLDAFSCRSDSPTDEDPPSNVLPGYSNSMAPPNWVSSPIFASTCDTHGTETESLIVGGARDVPAGWVQQPARDVSWPPLYPTYSGFEVVHARGCLPLLPRVQTLPLAPSRRESLTTVKFGTHGCSPSLNTGACSPHLGLLCLSVTDPLSPNSSNHGLFQIN